MCLWVRLPKTVRDLVSEFFSPLHRFSESHQIRIDSDSHSRFLSLSLSLSLSHTHTHTHTHTLQRSSPPSPSLLLAHTWLIPLSDKAMSHNRWFGRKYIFFLLLLLLLLESHFLVSLKFDATKPFLEEI